MTNAEYFNNIIRSHFSQSSLEGCKGCSFRVKNPVSDCSSNIWTALSIHSFTSFLDNNIPSFKVSQPQQFNRIFPLTTQSMSSLQLLAYLGPYIESPCLTTSKWMETLHPYSDNLSFPANGIHRHCCRVNLTAMTPYYLKTQTTFRCWKGFLSFCKLRILHLPHTSYKTLRRYTSSNAPILSSAQRYRPTKDLKKWFSTAL